MTEKSLRLNNAPTNGAFLGANDPKEIRVFESPMFGTIRVAGTSEEPLFCLADICGTLGIANPRNVKARLDEDDVHLVDTIDKLGRKQQVTFVSEGGLYDTIIRSDSEKAKPFRKWVTGEVLPTIRKTGSYGIPRSYSEALLLAANQAKKIEEQQQMLLESSETIKRKDEENAKLVAENKVCKPKAAYYDMIMANPSCSKVSSIAQDYGKSPQAFNDLLHDLGIQYKVDKQWILYQKYKDAGYVHSEPIPITHHDGHQSVKYLTVWTQKGRLFLYDLLKKKGILPLIEKSDSEAH